MRLVTAAALFDGHDAAINLMRRLLQATGAEVIHLGHNRSVREIVDAAPAGRRPGVAITSHQGGHLEFFKYLVVDLLRAEGAGISRSSAAEVESSSRRKSPRCRPTASPVSTRPRTEPVWACRA